jgi:acetamidase/formamidase
LAEHDAYILCSHRGRPEITEVVDAPNWTVGCFLPDALFGTGSCRLPRTAVSWFNFSNL